MCDSSSHEVLVSRVSWEDLLHLMSTIVHDSKEDPPGTHDDYLLLCEEVEVVPDVRTWETFDGREPDLPRVSV